MTQQHVTEHLDWMRIRGLSPLTVRARRVVLGGLAEFLADTPVLRAEAEQIQAWQHARMGAVAPPTRRNDLSHARAFYTWARRRGLRADDPTDALVMPRAPRRLPRPVPDPVYAYALAGADRETAVILALAGFAGLRAMEIARLDWSEVTLGPERARLVVACGKGGRDRLVPIPAALVETLRALPGRDGPVIRRLDGGHGYNSPNAITKRANRHLHGLGIGGTLHQLRHRFATAAYQGSRDIRAVQELLGHSSPTTTAVYAAASSAAVAQAVAAAGRLTVAQPRQAVRPDLQMIH